jgi:proteasome accessory factor B
VSAHRTERLLNLVICLLSTRRWLSKEQIRSAVPQYADCETTEAFDRMFERDKEDLREMGVPLVTGSDSAWFDDEVGYRIEQAEYALPHVDFTGEELAVLGLASRVWQQASLAGAATRAMVKLRGLGVELDDSSLIGVEPRVRTAEPAFESLYAATRDRAPVSFTYRKPSGEVSERELHPWAVASRSGRWYVVGHDRGRDAPRAFRLSRIIDQVRRIGPPGEFEVPVDLDAASLIQGLPPESDDREAVLLVSPHRGAALRLRAVDGPSAPDRAVPHETGGREVLRLRVGDLTRLAGELAGYGPDVVVLQPPDLRQAVMEHLRGSLSAPADSGSRR